MGMDTTAAEKKAGERPFWTKVSCKPGSKSVSLELHRTAKCSDRPGDLNAIFSEAVDASLKQSHTGSLKSLKAQGLDFRFQMPSKMQMGRCYNIMQMSKKGKVLKTVSQKVIAVRCPKVKHW